MIINIRSVRRILTVLILISIVATVFFSYKKKKTESDETINNSIAESTSSLDESTEFRGVWVNFYEFAELIKNKTEEEYKTAVNKMLDEIKALGLNAVILHVRSHCDSFYPSKIFPWSVYINGVQGSGVSFDPLAIYIELAHAKNIQVHAWVNPYRVSSNGVSPDILSNNNPIKSIMTDSDTENDRRVYEYNNGLYLNPASLENRKLIISGIKEIIENYDVDGIHFDDYFYPTTDTLIDGYEYALYCNTTSTPLSLTEWRKTQVNLIVTGVYQTIKAYNKDIVFGISPQANIKNNEDVLYADVKLWCKGGYADYICPQIYFGFEYPVESCTFTAFAEEWEALMSGNVKLYFGLAPYKLGAIDAASNEWLNCTDILKRQIEYSRKNTNCNGFVFYNYSSLFSTTEQNTTERNNVGTVFK